MPDNRCSAIDTSTVQDAFRGCGIRTKHHHKTKYADIQTIRFAVLIQPSATADIVKALELMDRAFEGRFIRAHISNVGTHRQPSTIVLIWLYASPSACRIQPQANLVWGSFNESLITDLVTGWRVPRFKTTLDV